jgi:hypothetical protein
MHASTCWILHVDIDGTLTFLNGDPSGNDARDHIGGQNFFPSGIDRSSSWTYPGETAVGPRSYVPALPLTYIRYGVATRETSSSTRITPRAVRSEEMALTVVRPLTGPANSRESASGVTVSRARGGCFELQPQMSMATSHANRVKERSVRLRNGLRGFKNYDCLERLSPVDSNLDSQDTQPTRRGRP